MSGLAILGGAKTRNVLFSPWPRFSESDRARLIEVLESRNWGGFPFENRFAREFSANFSAYHGAKYGCTVVNGTVAITVALRACGVGFGDEVITTAYTWDGTATAILDAGAVPVFADIDPDTYCIDVESVRRLITPKTKAIVPVHLAMRFADMDALMALAKEHGLAVVEDCAHVHGGFYKGRGAGSMGDAGTFSMQSSKLMTSGEGGAVITSRLDVLELVQTQVNCGRASETDEYGKRLTGCNYRITEFQAAMLLGQLETLPELTAIRAKNAARLSSAIEKIPHFRALPKQEAITTEPVYCYVFQYRPEMDGAPGRDLVAAALDAEGIPTDGRFYEPVFRSDLFLPTAEAFPQLALNRARPVAYREDFDCPVAVRAAYNEALWLPQFTLLGTEADVDEIAAAIEKVSRALPELAKADPKLAGVKGMSRAERPKIEKKNY
jgi:dTDP-4-amino-4,6-dideoxygalactose transaminase